MSPKTINDLETPSILIDLDIMERNIQKMQKKCDEAGLGFRAHIKTHKIPEIAQQQLNAGAVGIACQKTTETAIFVDAGFQDIQIPYNVLGEKKVNRLVELAKKSQITVSADHPDVVAGYSQVAQAHNIQLHVMVEMGTDIERTGAEDVQQVVALAQQIQNDPALLFAGILVYPSNPSVRPKLQKILAQLDELGINVENVSGGGTGASLHISEIPELTEIRVGTYIFNDWRTVTNGWCEPEDCAMTVLATVVSRASENRGILDSGSKTLAADNIDGFHGHIVEYPEATIYKLNEEHAYIDFSQCAERPKVGDQVHIIPVHTCVVTNLHNQIFGIRGDHIKKIWQVEARGLVW